MLSNGNLNPRALERHGITKEFAYQIYHDLSGPKLCKECLTPTAFLSFNKGYNTFCSNSCSGKNKDNQAKKMNTLQQNFGDDGFKSKSIQDKKRKTSLENYGTDHARKNKDYMKMLKQHYLDTYGMTNPALTIEANLKRDITNASRYGGNPQKDKTIRNKTKATNIERYGVSSVLLLPHARQKALATRQGNIAYEKLNDIDWLNEHKHIPSTRLAEMLGIAWSTVLTYYDKYGIIRPNAIVSNAELIVVEFLNQHNIRYEQSNRTILDGKEIDIYLPDYDLGIEIDGLYWHSEGHLPDKHYHLEKTNLASRKKIQLIHITDFEILNKFDIVKNRILSRLGKLPRIHARKCATVSVTYSDYELFMNKNHIQGVAKASIRYGLLYENELVAIMAFSKSRYNRSYEWELIRYATTSAVIGGASKLLTAFKRDFAPKSIISYADLRWNSGEMYDKIGMNYSHTSPPNYWYIENGKLVHRNKFQKHKLSVLLEKYDPHLSEWENMKLNGYDRYWDCGNKVYVWKK